LALPSKYSVSLPVEVVSSGGILIRQVDTNGVALDDGTYSYGVALPAMPVNSSGANEDSSLVFGVHTLVTLDPRGFPVIRVDAQGNAVSTPFGSSGTGYTAPVISNGVANNPPTFDSIMASAQDGDTIELDFTTDGSAPDGVAEDTHTLISTDESIGWPTLGLLSGGTTVKLRIRYGRGGTWSDWSNILTIGPIAAWTPSSYFISNTSGGILPQGMYYQVSAATCFTDAAGTVPVTAIGDQVYYLRDSSGNGIGVVQATATNRPTYQTTTGVFGTGKPYLQFDGTNDQLKSGTPSTFTFAQPIFDGFSIKHDNTTTQQITDGLTSTDRCALNTVSGTGWGMNAGTGANATFTLDTNDHTITALFNGAASYIRQDGSQSGALNPGTQAGTGITIGAAYQNSTYWQGRLYGGIRLYTNPSATLRSLIETWLTGLHQ
jgi:hypothetical protein